MFAWLKARREKPPAHRDVFGEFSVQLLFLIAEKLAAKQRGTRLRASR
jgi:hypothetical protein